MKIDRIDKNITQLLSKYASRNPRHIAKELNIAIFEEDLGEIYGYYNKTKRVKMIHLNSNLDEKMKLVTCAHELGHALLHPGANTPYLSKETIVSEWKIEKEANYFAARLIIDGSHHEYNFNSTYEILKFYGLPTEFERFIEND